jgi:uncharacterized protein YybS (DUF2232 family)
MPSLRGADGENLWKSQKIYEEKDTSETLILQILSKWSETFFHTSNERVIMDSLEMLIPIFGIVFSFGVPGIVLLRFLDMRNKERMALIEKGASIEELKDLFRNLASSPRSNQNNLRFGLLALFIGAGLFTAIQCVTLYNWPGEFVPAFILFSGGIGLCVFYIIAIRLDRKNNA